MKFNVSMTINEKNESILQGFTVSRKNWYDEIVNASKKLIWDL